MAHRDHPWTDFVRKEAEPTAASHRMRLQREHDTAPERAIRHELFRMGYRYRVHLRPLAGLRREADIAFPRARVAVFVHGCFWHGCLEHGTQARSNARFWRDKIARNRARDEETRLRLTEAGWTVFEIWEHEDAEAAANRLAVCVSGLRRALSSRSAVDET